MVILQDVHVRRNRQDILGPLSVTFGTGLTAIIGANGAGKSSLLRAIHGLERIHSGHIDAPKRTHQSFVFQTPVLVRRSVQYNLALPLILRKQPYTQAQIHRAAHRAGLEHKLNEPAHHLSGGEQQKLALARAFIIAPRLLLLDEPTTSLDGQAQRDIETVLTTAKGENTHILLATHSLSQVRRLADNVAFMHGGKITQPTPTARFFDAPPSAQANAYITERNWK